MVYLIKNRTAYRKHVFVKRSECILLKFSLRFAPRSFYCMGKRIVKNQNIGEMTYLGK